MTWSRTLFDEPSLIWKDEFPDNCFRLSLITEAFNSWACIKIWIWIVPFGFRDLSNPPAILARKAQAISPLKCYPLGGHQPFSGKFYSENRGQKHDIIRSLSYISNNSNCIKGEWKKEDVHWSYIYSCYCCLSRQGGAWKALYNHLGFLTHSFTIAA